MPLPDIPTESGPCLLSVGGEGPVPLVSGILGNGVWTQAARRAWEDRLPLPWAPSASVRLPGKLHVCWGAVSFVKAALAAVGEPHRTHAGVL